MHITLSPTLRKIGTLAAAVGLALGAATQPASAATGDTTTFLLTSDHCTGTCGGGINPQASFGSIVVTDLAGDFLGFNITLINGNKFVQTGLDLTFGFNLAANPTITYSALTAGYTIPGGTSPLQSAGSYHENGTGDFEYGLVWGGGTGGGNAAVNPVLSFTIGGTGLTLASLEQNAALQFFAARYHQWHHRLHWRRRRKPSPTTHVRTGTRDLRNVACRPRHDGIRSAPQKTESRLIRTFSSTLQKPRFGGVFLCQC